MIFYKDEVVEEVRRNREALLKEYGGIEGLHKHMREERTHLEMEGWKFESQIESAKRKRV